MTYVLAAYGYARAQYDVRVAYECCERTSRLLYPTIPVSRGIPGTGKTISERCYTIQARSTVFSDWANLHTRIS